LYLQGQYSESELVTEVQAGENEYANVSRDERLCEALFYVGEARWARGQPELALRYFAATVNIRMNRRDEHGLALAEIAKLQSRGASQPR
jgi:lipoprotein NlpI